MSSIVRERLSALPKRYPSVVPGGNSLQIRCFSAGKHPPGKNGGGSGKGSAERNNNNNNNNSDRNGNNNKGMQSIRAFTRNDQGNEYHHQRFKRRPRVFGPQNFFQAAMGPNKKYGIRSLNLKLVKDSAQVPILIPGKALVDRDEGESSEKSGASPNQDKPFQNLGTSNQKQGHQQRRRRRMLPIVNASALLDTQTYCIKSAVPGGVTTRSGTEAAKRLLRGKKDLVDMLRGHIILQQSQRPFCLAGHGVPKQLLQNHIDMADSILVAFNNPAEISLSNMDEYYSDPLAPDMKIRGHNGQSRIWAWPSSPQAAQRKEGSSDGDIADDDDGKTEHVDISRSWTDSLSLYLAVMNRIASKLGLVGSYLKKDSRKHWSVKMYRGMAYPSEVISRPDDEDNGGPVPILEWAPGNRVSNKQPHVSIRLQGVPELGGDSSSPVTLVYDACFQEDPRLEPILAT